MVSTPFAAELNMLLTKLQGVSQVVTSPPALSASSEDVTCCSPYPHTAAAAVATLLPFCSVHPCATKAVADLVVA
jgi:hypothetical protein